MSGKTKFITALVVLACGILLGSFLLSCSTGEERDAAGEKKTRLRFSFWGTIEERQITEEFIRAFEAEHPNIKIESEHINQDYMSKLLTELAADSAPDIIFVERAFVRRLVTRGTLLNLTPYIQNEKDFPAEDFQSQIWQAFNLEGGVYGVPRDMGAMVLFYNKKLFREAGVRFPPDSWDNDWWDWETFLDSARKLTKDIDGDGRIDQYGVVLNRWTDQWAPWVYQNQGRIMNDDMTRCLIDMPETIEGLQFLVDLSLKEKVAPTPMQLGDMGSDNVQMFEMGRVAMYPTGFWMVAEFSQIPNLEWDVAPYPKGKTMATTWHGSAYAIWSKTKHPKECWEFLKFSTTPESQIMMAKSGLLIPSRRSIANSDSFLKGETMPTNSRVFLEAFDHAKLTPNLTEMPELDFIVNENLGLAWDGIKPVPEVCSMIADLINEEIKKMANGNKTKGEKVQ